jgi:GntR family transcriptional regulator/MocR family aminotransferase
VRRVGDGSYVAYPLPRPARSAGEVLPRGPNAAAQRALAHFAPRLAQARRFDLPRHDLPAPVLHPRAWPQADFPLSTWRRAMATALSEDHRDQLGYGPAAGLPALREAIARHVALTRSVRCMPEQVLVVNSTAQGLETVARVLLRPGDRVWVEDPGHPGLPLLFEMLHLRAVGVPLDEQGLQVARGRELAADAALAVLHPLTQVPLGSAPALCAGPSCCSGPRSAGPGSSRVAATTRSSTAAPRRRRCTAGTPRAACCCWAASKA